MAHETKKMPSSRAICGCTERLGSRVKDLCVNGVGGVVYFGMRHAAESSEQHIFHLQSVWWQILCTKILFDTVRNDRRKIFFGGR